MASRDGRERERERGKLYGPFCLSLFRCSYHVDEVEDMLFRTFVSFLVSFSLVIYECCEKKSNSLNTPRVP